MDRLRSERADYPVIPYASPVAQYQSHKDAVDAAVARVLGRGSYILGREVESFEQAFATYCGVRHAIGVGSGTDALYLALKALDVGPSAEVITVSHTALATVAAVLATGATPILIDIDPQYYTLDPRQLDGAVTSRTKAVIAVHLYGQPADMDAIRAVSTRHGLPVIEDCAQAAGASYRGARVGSLGTIACFSFFPTKNLGAIGDGGMVITERADLADRVRRLRQYGWNARRETQEIGINSRLDEIQAAVLSAKLPSLDADNERRRQLAARYDEGLRGLPIELPVTQPNGSHVFHLYVIATDDRDRLRSHLTAAGIATGIHYERPAHRYEGYADRVGVTAQGLPVTQALAGRILSLPIYPELALGDADRVIAAIRTHYT